MEAEFNEYENNNKWHFVYQVCWIAFLLILKNNWRFAIHIDKWRIMSLFVYLLRNLQKVRMESLQNDFTSKEARKQENKSFNRYKDVTPCE